MMKRNKAYYSEPLSVLNGRLQVTPDRVTLEVIGEDLDGRRRICSVPLSDDTASNLRQRWDDKGENDIITLYDGFLPIASQETMAQIADEIEEAAKRGLSVRCVLFPEKTSPSIEDRFPLEKTTPEEKSPERKKRPRIHASDRMRDAQNPQEYTLVKDAGNVGREALAKIITGLMESAEQRNNSASVYDMRAEGYPAPVSAPEFIPIPELKPKMPNMDNYPGLGNDPYLEMLRGMSFPASNPDCIRAKAVLLLCVMDMVATGAITNNRIVPDINLQTRFNRNWHKLQSKNGPMQFSTAFLQMDDERFWNLEPSLSTARSNGESVIKTVRFATMDQKLFLAMKDIRNRGNIRVILTARTS